MEYGPDGLLYASSLTGTDGNYVATVVHQIDLLSQIPNHIDVPEHGILFGHSGDLEEHL